MHQLRGSSSVHHESYDDALEEEDDTLERSHLRAAMGGRLTPPGFQAMQRALGNQEVLRVMRTTNRSPIHMPWLPPTCDPSQEDEPPRCEADPHTVLELPAICPLPAPRQREPDGAGAPPTCEVEPSPGAPAPPVAWPDPELPDGSAEHLHVEHLLGPWSRPNDDVREPLLHLDMPVRIHHDEHNPLLAPHGAVRDDDLYELSPADPCAGDVTWLREIRRSAAHPQVFSTLDTRTVFIDGAPSAGDVAQGALGDCWLLAAAASLARQDPQALIDLFEVRGDVVVVRLWASPRDAHPLAIPVSMTLPLVLQEDGPPLLPYADVRVSDHPQRQLWHVRERASIGVVMRRDEYEAALWVALLEKAGAILMARLNPRTPGMKALDGGLPERAFAAILGPRGRTQRGARRDPSRAEDWPAHLQRVADGEVAMVASATGDQALYGLLAGPLPDDMKLLADLARANRGLAEAEREAIAVGGRRWLQDHPAPPAALDPRSPEQIAQEQRLRRLIRTLATLDGQAHDTLWISTPHAYSVLDAHIVPSSVVGGALLGAADLERSTVTLRNPHGGNSPVEKAAPEDDGVFTLTLAELLETFDTLDTVQRR